MQSVTPEQRYLDDLKGILDRIPLEVVDRVIDRLAEAAVARQRVFIFGNGGSASTASHFACDLAKGTIPTAPSRLRVVALTDNVALMTAWANDAAYQEIFAEQLRNLVEPGDVVIAISASGRSPNVLRAVEVAAEHGATTVGMTGFDGGQLVDMVDYPILVTGGTIEQIEDAHLILQHLICTSLRERFARGRDLS
ncbi:MAG: SIS domain-containing protein [Thermomicrobiaceae bacterium]|nr:SIS domain-containing protein [Thermomicrobiaceae bacterium]